MARRARTISGTHPSGPLPTAAAAGDVEELKALLDGGHAPDGRDRDGNTALHFAFGSGRHHAAALLLWAGSDPFLRNDAGGTPFDVLRERLRSRYRSAGNDILARFSYGWPVMERGLLHILMPDAAGIVGKMLPLPTELVPGAARALRTDSAWLLHDPDGLPLCVLLVENQSRADRTMPERITVYCAGLREMLGNRRPEAPPPDILPFVVSTARGQWRVPTGTEPSRLPEAFSGHARFSFGYNVLDVGRRPDLDDSNEPVALFLRIRWMAAKRNPSPDDRRRLTLLASRLDNLLAGAQYSVLRKVLMASVADELDPETLSRIERGNGMSPMLQSFKEEGREEGLERGREEGLERGLERGMMRADREVLSVLFASRFDPGTVRLLNEAAEAIADPTVLHGATHDAVRSTDNADILRLFGIARNGSAH